MSGDRGVLRPLMYNAVRQGTSFNAFYRSARSHDIAMRRSDMLADWSDVRSEVQSELKQLGTKKGEIPTATVVSNVKFTRPGFYYYRVRVDYFQPTDEGNRNQFITAVFEQPQTVDAILREVGRKFEAGAYESLDAVKGFQFVSALHSPIP